MGRSRDKGDAVTGYMVMGEEGETIPSAKPRARARAGQPSLVLKRGWNIPGANLFPNCSRLLEKWAPFVVLEAFYLAGFAGTSNREKNRRYEKAGSAERRFS